MKSEQLETANPGPEDDTKHKPTWEKFIPNCDVLCDTSYESHVGKAGAALGGQYKLNNGTFLWPKDVTLLQRILEPYREVKARTTIFDGLARLSLGFDEVENKIHIEPPMAISGPYAFTSYVSFRGAIPLDGQKPRILLVLQYCDDEWIFAERATIATDGEKWDTPKLKFRTENRGRKLYETAYLDLDDVSILREVLKIITAKRSIIRFLGPDHYSDLVVGSEMKKNLGVGLLAFSELGLHRELFREVKPRQDAGQQNEEKAPSDGK
ncbi:MAG: hypothetical protein NTY19_21775 [Planctomycetota bacterium]|nr:hypothetical protein [Planctomycetota bacterium]